MEIFAVKHCIKSIASPFMPFISVNNSASKIECAKSKKKKRETEAHLMRSLTLAFTVVSLHATKKFSNIYISFGCKNGKINTKFELRFFFSSPSHWNCCWSKLMYSILGRVSQWEAFNNSQNKKYIFLFVYSAVCSLKHT